MNVNISITFNKRLVITLAATTAVLAAGWFSYTWLSDRSPIPPDVSQKANFSVLYPGSSDDIVLDEGSFVYQSETKSVVSSSKFRDKTIIITQQAAPPNLASGSQIYYQALGLRPYAQFNAKLGPVALAKFWQSGSLEPSGQAGILMAQNTLLIARPQDNQELTNDEWKTFFNSLKISQ